jgi:hypothetical protein
VRDSEGAQGNPERNLLNMSLTRKLTLGAIGVAALVGTGAAVAAASGHGHGHAKTTTAKLSTSFFGMAGKGGFMHGGFGIRGMSDDFAAAASYLGITTDQLKTDLQSGKTLAQVADATSGKSAAGLVDALVAHEKSELAAAVTAGKLTQAQADAVTAGLQQRVTDLVNGKATMHAGPYGHWHGWGGGPGAPPSSGGGTNA